MRTSTFVRFTRHAILAVAVLALAGIVSVGNATPPQPGPLDVSGEINRGALPDHCPGRLERDAGRVCSRLHGPGRSPWRDRQSKPNHRPEQRCARFAARQGLRACRQRPQEQRLVGRGRTRRRRGAGQLLQGERGQPVERHLVGRIGGTVIALETAERNGGAFDGFSPQPQWAPVRRGHGIRPSSSDWPTTSHSGCQARGERLVDIRDDLDFETDVAPIVTAQAADPANFGRFEFIRMVAGVPGQGITPPPGFYPGQLVAPGRYFYFATEGEAELERRAGGPIGQNISHVYALTEAEKVYLASLGVDAEPLLEAMNAPPEHRGSAIAEELPRALRGLQWADQASRPDRAHGP